MRKKDHLTILLIGLTLFLGTGLVTRTDKQIIQTITTDELLKLDFNKLEVLDSASAYRICKQNSMVHDWDTYLLVLEISKKRKEIENNLEKEKEKSIKEFLERHDLFNFKIKAKENIKAIITKSKKSSNAWTPIHLKLILTNIGNIDTTILVSEYLHVFAISELESKSITHFYSDNSIEFTQTTDKCFDFSVDSKTHCDSTKETINYSMDFKSNRVYTNRTFKVFPYTK